MLFGTSRHVHVGVNAPISLMVAVTINEVGAKTDEQRVTTALAITAITSVVYLLMMALRLDLIATFVPDPVVSGFCTAMALQIMSSNLKYVVGMPLNTDSVMSTVVDLARKARLANPAAAAFFAAGCALLVAIKWFNVRYCRLVPIPEQLVLLLAATSISRRFNLRRTAGPWPAVTTADADVSGSGLDSPLEAGAGGSRMRLSHVRVTSRSALSRGAGRGWTQVWRWWAACRGACCRRGCRRWGSGGRCCSRRPPSPSSTSSSPPRHPEREKGGGVRERESVTLNFILSSQASQRGSPPLLRFSSSACTERAAATRPPCVPRVNAVGGRAAGN